MKNIDKIKLTSDSLTTRARTAFLRADSAEPTRAFLAKFANIGETYVLDHTGAHVFTFQLEELEQVQARIKAATGKVIDAHEHNGVLDLACDIVNDKYCVFRIIISHDAYSADYNNVTIKLHRRTSR